ncbi:MAG: DeoR/GlpR family DNA-binding transcription regulator [Chitinophagaceae bacterium]|nr:DeoR/GlpR family DNA-binding transcription regulator [Chitinophagaceae bacterium]MCU0403523.1 DeoR/GlpR family DNA-binding transcription regulator [Chitinophagaceae bacterium]
MLKKERQAFILQQLNVHNKVISADLCEQLGVSEDTVRRDLQELSDEGSLLKVHGGALSKSFHFRLQNEPVYHEAEKRNIAEKAASLISDGMVVLLSGGTTIRQLINVLPPSLNATFITISIPIALELMNHPGSEVIFIGNKLDKNTQTAMDAEVVKKLSAIKADICFLGTNSISADNGITDSEWSIVEIKQSMVQSADQLVSLAISEKLGVAQRFKVCDIDEVDVLITELNSQDARLNAFRSKGIRLI